MSLPLVILTSKCTMVSEVSALVFSKWWDLISKWLKTKIVKFKKLFNFYLSKTEGFTNVTQDGLVQPRDLIS